MKKIVCFIGHRSICNNNIKLYLYKEIKKQIENGCKHFMVGTHGDFDNLVLYVLRELKKNYKDILIEVVITSLNQIKPKFYDLSKKATPYNDVKTVMFDIENLHYKRRIIASNKFMIDNSQILICYVDTKKTFGGAIIAFNYATKKGLHVVNLF